MNRALLEQGTGIALTRREEIVSDAHRYYVDTLPITGMEQYGFSDTPSFDNAVLDFDSRMLPEYHTPRLGELRAVPDIPEIQDRYMLLTGIANAIERSPLVPGQGGDALHDGVDEIGIRRSKAIFARKFFDPRAHFQREQLVIDGGY